MSEEALLVLLSRGSGLDSVRVPYPTLDSFRKASDKAHVTALAATMGMAVPQQVVVDTHSALAALDLGSLTYPVVLKPARSVAGDGLHRTKLAVAYAENGSALRRLADARPASAFPLLLQQRIEGPGIGIFLLRWEGRVLAQFAHRRLREKPPSGGVSVLSESIATDPTLVSQSRALLAALDWCGPAMIEFKQDRATGRHYLMEVNGRFWGSLQLAVDAGVDFPSLLVAAALGATPMPVTQYQVGVRVRWWWGDVDHLIARMRGGASALALGSRAQAVGQFLRPGPAVRNEVLRAEDPWPFARETIDWLRRR
jgi:predicted ATP-grasp superfamily ATP-dependent carboligase